MSTCISDCDSRSLQDGEVCRHLVIFTDSPIKVISHASNFPQESSKVASSPSS